MDNVLLSSSDLLGIQPGQRLTSEQSGTKDSSLSSQVWDWVSDHKTAIGIGAVAAAGIAAAAVFGRPQAIQAAEGLLSKSAAEGLENAASRRLSEAGLSAALDSAARVPTAGLTPMLEQQGAESLANATARELAPNLELLGSKEITEKAIASASLAPTAEALSGDISRIKADALITPINSEGMWFGALDGVIQRAGGNQFHKQAAAAMPLIEGQAVVAKQLAAHRGAFANVVFVVDDLGKPLRDVVNAGLKAADAAGYKSVTLPAMRTGVMMGAVEKTAQATVDEMAAGVKAFTESGAKSLKDIKFVVYNNPDILEKLTKALANH